MELSSIPLTVANTGVPHGKETPGETLLPVRKARDPGELFFEIGLWLTGLESFLSDWDHVTRDSEKYRDPAADWTKEFQLSYSVLVICANLNYDLRTDLARNGEGDSRPSVLTLYGAIFNEFTVKDCDDLLLEVRDLITLNRALADSRSLNFDAWKVWNNFLLDKLRNSAVIRRFISQWERAGTDYMPPDLKRLLMRDDLSYADRIDLEEVLTRFSVIMKALAVVGSMLREDEPLKPTVLIFAKVHEKSRQLIEFINGRLSRFQDEGAELFASLDGASYTASIELKKVYQQELPGLVAIRPAPSIHAKVETAYALLNDSFEQILAGFARLVDPHVVVTQLFPGIQLKLEQSLTLRSGLWRLLQAVKAAEEDPQTINVEEVKKRLIVFMDEPVRFLFFKDRETLERFHEEVLAAKENTDLVPILHRFGAYLETLFGLVNMRTVLASHPFVESR